MSERWNPKQNPHLLPSFFLNADIQMCIQISTSKCRYGTYIPLNSWWFWMIELVIITWRLKWQVLQLTIWLNIKFLFQHWAVVHFSWPHKSVSLISSFLFFYLNQLSSWRSVNLIRTGMNWILKSHKSVLSTAPPLRLIDNPCHLGLQIKTGAVVVCGWQMGSRDCVWMSLYTN